MARWTEGRGIAQRLSQDLTTPTGALLAAALASALLAAVVVAALVLHLLGISSTAGAVVLSLLASALIVGAYLRLPKPTLLVFALFVLFRDTIARYLGFSVTYVDDLVAPLLFLLALWQFRPWRSGRLAPLREAAVMLVVGLAVLSSLVNAVPAAVWLPGLLLLVKVIAFLYVAAWHDYTRADIRQFALVVGAVGVVVIGLGYVEAIDPPAFRQALGLSQVGVARGDLPSLRSLFFHPVLFGWFASFLGLFLFAAYAVYRRWWLLAGGLFFTAAVFLSARRRALGGLIAGLLGGLLAQVGRGQRLTALARAWTPVGAGVLALTLVFSSGIGELIALTERHYGPPIVDTDGGSVEPPAGDAPRAGAARLLLYQGSAEVAQAHFPLGAGLGRYGSWMSRLEYSPLYYELGFDRVWGLRPDYPNFITDTFWPQILGEIGVFGLLAYLVFVGVVGLDLVRAARAFREPLLMAFCLGVLMVFAHALVETLASSMFHSPPRIYLLFGAVGMALALLRQAGRQQGAEGA